MIVTVTPNPALDITYRLGGDGLRVGRTNRIVEVAERAGGKGLNVARVLAAYRVPVVALGLLGGATGDVVRAGLDAAGIDHDFTRIAGHTRRTVVVTSSRQVGADPAVDGPGSGGPGSGGPASGGPASDGPGLGGPGLGGPGLGGKAMAGLAATDPGVDGATGLWEPGPAVTRAEWRALVDRVGAYLDRASVLVLAGSLPPGVPVTGYAELIRLARAARVPVILDADGDALRHGLAAGPSIAKPNAAELTALTGHPVSDVASAVTAIASIDDWINAINPAESNANGRREGGIGDGGGSDDNSGSDDSDGDLKCVVHTRPDLVVSLGAAGLLAVTAEGTWSARPPATYPGNATGAGDAAVAALALGLLENSPWPARLTRMIAWSAAAAAHPVAGELDPALAARLHATAIVTACESR